MPGPVAAVMAPAPPATAAGIMPPPAMTGAEPSNNDSPSVAAPAPVVIAPAPPAPAAVPAVVRPPLLRVNPLLPALTVNVGALRALAIPAVAIAAAIAGAIRVKKISVASLSPVEGFISA